LLEKTIDAPVLTQLEGDLESTTGLLWVVAKFEQDQVQLNVLNKVKVKIFSKLQQHIKVEAVELITNVPKHNKTISLIKDDLPFSLSK